MRLSDLEPSRVGGVRYVGALRDSAGNTFYELGVSGPAALIRKVLAECNFEYWIEPKATEKDWPARSRKFWEGYASANASARQLETVAALNTMPPQRPTSKDRSS